MPSSAGTVRCHLRLLSVRAVIFALVVSPGKQTLLVGPLLDGRTHVRVRTGCRACTDGEEEREAAPQLSTCCPERVPHPHPPQLRDPGARWLSAFSLLHSTCACVEYYGKALEALLKRVKILCIHGKMKYKRNKIFLEFRKLQR